MPRRVTGSIGDEVMLKHKRKARSVKNSSGKSRKRKRSASPPPSPSYSPGNTDLSSYFGSATPSKDRALSIQKLSETPKSKKQLIYNNNNNKFKKDNINHGRKTYNLDVSEDDHSDETLDGDVDDEICFSNNEMILTSNETNNKNSKLTVNEGNRNDFTVIKKNLTHNQKKKDASEVLLKLCKTNPLLRNNPAIINAIQEEIKKNELPKDLSSLLRDVTAYVEVRATHEDRSECVIEELRKLGANIKLNLTRKVTHFIFHNGRKSTYLKAKSWNVHIVSVLWVESCKTSGKKMPEEDFPAVAPDLSDSSKRMRFRNMVPSALTPTSKKRRKSTTTPLPPAPTTTPCSPFDHFPPSPMVRNILQDLVNSTPSYPEPLFSSDDEWLSSQEKRELNAPLAKRLFSHLSTTDPQPVDRSGFVDTTDMASPESSKDEETFKCSPRKETPKSVPATPTKSQENKPLKHNSKQSKSNNHIHPSIVMTNLHASDRDVISSIVQSIGGFLLKAEVDNTTTHVICGERRRTLSVLFAISKGCWLLDKEWVFRSLEVGRWIEEEPYELNEYFPTAQISRLERLMEISYKQTVFTEAGFMYVAENSLPPKPKLQELIRLAGGEVVTCKRRAKFCIGMFSKNQDIISLTEKWILDSIEAHKMLPIEEYLIHQH